MPSYRGSTAFDELPSGVRGLLVVNVFIFLIQMISPGLMVRYLGLTPILVIEKFWIWQVFTYSFLHGNFWHLFFNMFALWMFGAHIERNWGTQKFLRFYFVCVAGAALTQFIFAPAELVVGSSGGIYGLLLAFGVLFPDVVIYLFFLFPFRAKQAVAIIALFSFVAALSSGGSRVAHFAHLGGMLTGLLYFKLPPLIERLGVWRLKRRFARPRGRLTVHRSEDEELTGEVDRILEKISSQGIDSLTEKEHETMRRYSLRKQ